MPSVRSRCRFAFALCTGVAAAAGVPSDAEAHEIAFQPHDLPTVFYISKSDDHNRVDYGIHLDARCLPASDDAVFPYWREFENSPPVRTHSLGLFEYIGYGISEQKTVRRTATGGTHVLRLRQFKQLQIGIQTQVSEGGRCSAQARMAIQGREAELAYMHVQLEKGGFAPSVLYVDVHGRDLDSGRELVERFRR
jgi:hypothetical protein